MGANMHANMQAPNTANAPIACLDVFGQQPGIQIYTQICLCFSVANATQHSEIVSTLTSGLKRLSASFPWIAGQVVNEGSSIGNTGTYMIRSLDDIPRLVVKDLRHDSSIPTMETLREAKFPFNMLDETIIAPRNTIPGSGIEASSDSMPVFLLQASFITGGLLLTFVGQHGVMDMTGQGQVMRLISKACHNDPFSSEELSICNLDGRKAIPLLDDSFIPGAEFAHQMMKPSSTAGSMLASTDGPTALPFPPPCAWAYFVFSPASLASLKSLATASLPDPLGYISTDDALSAFIWQSIMRARLARIDQLETSTFARAVDPRRYLGIPETYPGIVQNMTYAKYPIQKLNEEPLGVIAAQLRLAVDPKTSSVAHDTRALATILDRAADKSIASITATLDLSRDLMLSSWANLDSYELDFNLGLGKPAAVRRPRLVPVESLIYLMPKTTKGEIAVGLCLREEDMLRLRGDRVFAKFATYIG